MEAREHADLLRDFFTNLFRPDETVYIFPCLSEKARQEISEGRRKLPVELHKRELTYFIPGKGVMNEPHHFLPAFQRTASSTNTAVIEKLKDFNNLGYEIYFAVNPLTCRTRCQRTVYAAHHVVLEADDTDLDLQKRILNDYRDYFSAIIYTGNKSLHAYAKIDPAIPNYSRVGWKDAPKLKSIGKPTTCSLPQYDAVANFWIEELRQQGLQLDVSVARDFSRVSRVPGFKHSKTGKVAEVLFLNPTPLGSQIIIEKRYWAKAWSPEPHEAPHNVAMGKDSISTDVISPELQPSVFLGEDVSPIDNQVSYIENSVRNPITSSDNQLISENINSRERRKRRTTKTNVIREQSFLDYLKAYETLKRDGITRRGVRRSCHAVLFICKEIYGWNKEQMAAAWRAIVTLHPENIGMAPEAAVEQLLEHYAARQGGSRLSLPNTLSLPQDLSFKREHLMAALRGLGCDRPQDVANITNIILRVLWKPIRELPLQCQRGQVGIKAVDFQRECAQKNYKPALAWLEQHHILRLTNASYVIGKRTRQYAVNIPLIVYLLGFQTEELDCNVTVEQGELLMAS